MTSVDQDLYFLAAEQDHIAPWRSSYTGARCPSGNVRFVLSNSGHIAGIVNPPNPKSSTGVAATEELPENPDEWLAAATMTRPPGGRTGRPGSAAGRPSAPGQGNGAPVGRRPGTYVSVRTTLTSPVHTRVL